MGTENKTSKVESGYSATPPAGTVRTCGVWRMSGPADAPGSLATPSLPSPGAPPLATTLHRPSTTPASGLLPLPGLTLFFPPLKSFPNHPHRSRPKASFTFPQFTSLPSSFRPDYAHGRPLNAPNALLPCCPSLRKGKGAGRGAKKGHREGGVGG